MQPGLLKLTRGVEAPERPAIADTPVRKFFVTYCRRFESETLYRTVNRKTALIYDCRILTSILSAV